MKTLPTGWPAALAAGMGTKLAMIVVITCANGLIKRFTDAPRDITLSGDTYLSGGGVNRTAMSFSEGLESSTFDLDAFLIDGFISKKDILAGIYRGALVEVSFVIFENTSLAPLPMMQGHIGESELLRLTSKQTVHSLSDLMTMAVARVTTPTCGYTLGETACGVNVAPFIVSATITSVVNDASFRINAALTSPTTGVFNYGKVTFTGGENSGLQGDISGVSVAGGSTDITLWLPMGYTVAIGDTLDARPGCDNKLATCLSPYNNVINFGGQPYVPGIDKMNQGTQ